MEKKMEIVLSGSKSMPCMKTQRSLLSAPHVLTAQPKEELPAFLEDLL